MLSKTVTPRTKGELIAALQRAAFEIVEVFEGPKLSELPSLAALKRQSQTVIVLKPR